MTMINKKTYLFRKIYIESIIVVIPRVYRFEIKKHILVS